MFHKIRFNLGNAEVIEDYALVTPCGDGSYVIDSPDGHIPGCGYCETHDFYYDLEMCGCRFLQDIFGSSDNIENPNVTVGRSYNEIARDPNSNYNRQKEFIDESNNPFFRFFYKCLLPYPRRLEEFVGLDIPFSKPLKFAQVDLTFQLEI